MHVPLIPLLRGDLLCISHGSSPSPVGAVPANVRFIMEVALASAVAHHSTR